jgi:type II secretory pathway pseudopilin PulG
MGNHTQTGFTVIEVMLFLAVTGLLAIGILVGSGITISQQRYRDSVTSLKSYLQQQYSEVGNVINGRDKTWTCDSTGAVSEVPSGEARGTSDCVILGRFITIDVAGTKLNASNVVGYRVPSAPVGASDIAEIASNYRLASSPIDQNSEEVSWGAQIVHPGTPPAPMPLSLLIIRSPLSGSIMTFSAEGVQTNLNSLITLANTTTRRDLCVNADAGSFMGKRMEVRIDARATNQGSILIPPESDSVCG